MLYKSLTIFLTILYFHGQGQGLSNLKFGTDSTLDIATWNIERFPKRNQTTVDSVAQIIKALKIDVWGLQEINDLNELRKVVAKVPGYAVATGTGTQRGLAYVYNSSQINVSKVYRIYDASTYSSPFPRRPLVMEFVYKGDDYLLINNHFKCCGDGTISPSNTNDEEVRRRNASRLLKKWVDSLHSKDYVIILGDLNDILTDSKVNNVFQDYFDDLTNYRIADLLIENGSSKNWSYPSWPSHLDHMIITNEVSDKLNKNNSEITCIQPDTFLNAKWSDYDYMISDHRPVAIRLDYKEQVKDTSKDTTSVAQFANLGISIYPNPVSNLLFLEIDSDINNAEIEIVNSNGQLMDRLKILNQKFNYSFKELENGVYFLNVKSKGILLERKKVLVIH